MKTCVKKAPLDTYALFLLYFLSLVELYMDYGFNFLNNVYRRVHAQSK